MVKSFFYEVFINMMVFIKFNLYFGNFSKLQNHYFSYMTYALCISVQLKYQLSYKTNKSGLTMYTVSFKCVTNVKENILIMIRHKYIHIYIHI